MKILWIEDFDKGTKPELEKYWGERYELTQGYDVILKKSLTSALAYIDDERNDFDSVIIDINLDSNDEELGSDYEGYINGIISKEFLESQEDIDGIGGFLIFLKLILQRNFPKERIIFLTNNYTEENPAAEIVNDIEDTLGDCDKANKFIEVCRQLCKKDQDYIKDLLEELGNAKHKFEDEIFDRFETDTVQDYIGFLKEICEKVHEDKAITVENSNTYNKYKKVFCGAGIEPSKPLMKEDIDHNQLCHRRHTTRLLKWKQKMNSDYHVLRRAIREISDEVIKLLNDKEQLDKFYIFDSIPNINNDSRRVAAGEDEKIYSVTEIRDTFFLLRNLLPLKEPDEVQKRKLYVQIVRTISHYWEIKSAWYMDGFRKDEYYKNLRCVMKLLRNWMAHNKMDEKEFTEADVAFLFIIALRTYFNLGCTLFSNNEAIQLINHYELKLLGLQKEKISERELLQYFRVENRTSKMEKIMRLSFTNITKKEMRSFKRSYYSKENIGYNVYTKMKNIGSPDSEEKCTLTDLYKLVWHCIFYSYLARYDERSEDLTTLVVRFSFFRENSFLNRDEILTQIYLNTFYRTFKDEIAAIDEESCK